MEVGEDDVVQEIDALAEEVQDMITRAALRLGLDEAEVYDRLVNEMTARREVDGQG